MKKRRKIILAIIFALLIAAVVVGVVFAISFTKKKCNGIWQGGVKVARVCYEIRLHWLPHPPDPSRLVGCVGEGELTYNIYKDGYWFTDPFHWCQPDTYDLTAQGSGELTLWHYQRGELGTWWAGCWAQGYDYGNIYCTKGKY